MPHLYLRRTALQTAHSCSVWGDLLVTRQHPPLLLPVLRRSPTSPALPSELQSRKVTSGSFSLLSSPLPLLIHFHPRRAGVFETRLPSARLSSAKSFEAEAEEEAERGGGRGSRWSPPVTVAPTNDRRLIAPPTTPGEWRGDGERAAARARKPFSL